MSPKPHVIERLVQAAVAVLGRTFGRGGMAGRGVSLGAGDLKVISASSPGSLLFDLPSCEELLSFGFCVHHAFKVMMG